MTKEEKKQIIKTATERFGEITTIKKNDLTKIAQEYGFSKISYSWIKNYRVDHGVYDLTGMADDLGIEVGLVKENEKEDSTIEHKNSVTQPVTEKNLVPAKNSLFVKTKEYKTLNKVVKSGRFYPVFITGLSGNGKSMSVIQAAAHNNRELIRINVTKGTSDEDLIGHWALEGGETRWIDGPVVQAMKRGAVLLIDEIDALDANKSMGLFTVLEGNGVYIKQTNSSIHHAPGFNVIATANTKGKGSDDGRFMGTNILNEAFLERFPITLEYNYPGKKQENKILQNVADSLDITDSDFIKNLVDWGSIIRKTFYEGAVDEVITTRRLVNILHAFAIFENKREAIELSINRFDDDTKEGFMSLFEKLDDNAIEADEDGNEVTVASETSGEAATESTDGLSEPTF